MTYDPNSAPLEPDLVWITGEFSLLNDAPDGDTLRFYPDFPEPVRAALPGLRWQRSVGLSVRLDGTDAPETRFLAHAGMVMRQPAPWGELAARGVLDFLGFGPAVRRPDGVIVNLPEQACRGMVAVRRIDRYGRALGLVFRGHAGPKPPHRQPVTSQQIDHSLNAFLLHSGLTYPLIYRELPGLLKNSLRSCARGARQSQMGLWNADHSQAWIPLEEPASLETALIWPPLFRRFAVVLCRQSKVARPQRCLSALERSLGHLILPGAADGIPWNRLCPIQGNGIDLRIDPCEVEVEKCQSPLGGALG